MRHRTDMLAVVALLLGASSALAGPPFATDDPEPTPQGQFENYLYTSGTQTMGVLSGTGLGVEFNYGAFADTQVTLDLPSLDYGPAAKGGTRFGLGTAALSVKYRFVEEDKDGWRPQVGTFPAIEIPLNSSDGKNARQFFPVWAQKSFGDWTSFGGGGYWNNPGPGNRNYWFFGAALLRQIAPDFAAGAELFHRTPDTVDGKDSTSLGVGMLYDFSDTLHLIGSFNTAVQNRQATNAFSYFVALKWTTDAAR